LHEANRLLSWGSLSVKEVAARIGFNDASHFTRDYRRVYQENPSDTRAKARRAA
jgi:transcriptional regulator GlxA family with amidase domain